MPALETGKKIVEKITGWSRPAKSGIAALVRARKANVVHFRDDGIIPNHPRWPLILYRGAVRLPIMFDPAAVFEDLFESNGWGDSWRNGIYDYVHYHSPYPRGARHRSWTRKSAIRRQPRPHGRSQGR
jgi:hypothetical protein